MRSWRDMRSAAPPSAPSDYYPVRADGGSYAAVAGTAPRLATRSPSLRSEDSSRSTPFYETSVTGSQESLGSNADVDATRVDAYLSPETRLRSRSTPSNPEGYRIWKKRQPDMRHAERHHVHAHPQQQQHLSVVSETYRRSQSAMHDEHRSVSQPYAVRMDVTRARANHYAPRRFSEVIRDSSTECNASAEQQTGNRRQLPRLPTLALASSNDARRSPQASSDRTDSGVRADGARMHADCGDATRWRRPRSSMDENALLHEPWLPRRKLPSPPPDFRKAIRDASTQILQGRETPPHCQTPPPVARKKQGAPGYQPDMHITSALKSYDIRRLCQRRTSEQSADNYVGTPCTCVSEDSGHDSDRQTEQTDEAEGRLPSLRRKQELYRQGSESSQSVPDSSVTLPPSPVAAAKHAGAGTAHDGDEGNYLLASSAMRARSATDVPTTCDSRDRGSNVSAAGEIQFSIQYFPIRKRLRVSINRANNLCGQVRSDVDLNTFARVCLNPGKIQRQQSRIVKRTRDAVFNEEFFFDNVSDEDIKEKTLKLQVLHRTKKQFRRDSLLGEVDIPLVTVNGLFTKHEIRMSEPLKGRLSNKKLGRLHITTTLELESKRFTVYICKADGLQKNDIGAPPDPCIRISLDQKGKVQTKQSRVIKHSCNPSYNEGIMFLIQPSSEVFEQSSVLIEVVDTSRSDSNDNVIGKVQLGQHGAEKSELEQWRQTVTRAGKAVKATHHLHL